MKSFYLLLLGCCTGLATKAQKIDSIYFHLYTDSLKKGFFNYINVDGKTADGLWVPLSAKEIIFSTNKDSALRFENNDLFIDSAYQHENVTIKAVLRANPKIWRTVTVFIRKRGFDEALPSNEEVFQEYSKPQKKKRKQ